MMHNRHNTTFSTRQISPECYSSAFRSRSEFEITDTELKLIAAAARLARSAWMSLTRLLMWTCRYSSGYMTRYV